jgi:hypothetical protein
VKGREQYFRKGIFDNGKGHSVSLEENYTGHMMLKKANF